MATLDTLNVIISAKTDELERGFARAEAKLDNFGGTAKKLAASVGALFAFDKVADFGKAVLSSAGDIQALEKGFAATYKGSEQLSTALDKVRELAKLPGLGLKEALQGATNLQAAGFSADLATRALGAFGNALATVGRGKADLDGVGLALGQIASKGKISAEEINQLAERVPQIRQAMIAAFGTADTEVLQKANISATAFVEGVTAQLEKLPKVTGGINNAFENLEDASTTALAKLGTSLNNAFNIEGLVNAASGALSDFGDEAAGLEPTFRSIAAYFGPAGEGGFLFGQLAESATNAATEIKGAFDALNGSQNSVGFVKEMVKEIVIGFTAAADVIGGVIGTITRALKGDFVGAEEQAQRALGGLTAPLRNALGLTTQLSGTFTGAFGAAAQGVDYFAEEVDYFAETQDKAKTAVVANTKEIEKQAKALIALNKGYDNIGARTTKGLAPKDAPDFIELQAPAGQALPTVLPPIDTAPFVASAQEATAQMALFQLTAETFSAGLSNVLVGGLADIATGFGEGIGNILAGAGGLEDLGGIVLGALGGLAIQVGQLAIATGIAVAGIKAALESLNPVAAIVGGIALVALGTAVKGAASGISRSGGSGGSGLGGSSLGSAPRSNFTPSVAPSAAAQGPATVTHNVQVVIAGNQLTGLLQIQTDRIGRVIGK